MITKCPCCSGKLYHQCCEPVINKSIIPETAEQLMRSRYTAFTQANIDYLMYSHHPKTRPIKDKKEIKKWCQSVKWVGLQVLKVEGGSAKDTEGMVEFKALFMDDLKPEQIYETSKFVKYNQRWVYYEGIHNT